MREVVALFFVLLQASIDIWYCRQIVRGKIAPALTTWLLFFVGTSASLGSYVARGRWSLVSGVGNTFDVFGTFVIAAVLIFSGHRKVRRFDIWCLSAAGVLLFVWAVAHQHLIVNLSMQALMVVAYGPTLGKLWRADENTEDVWFWVVCFAASVLAAYPPLAARDALQSVYALRAVVCTAVVIALSVRLQFHSRKGVRA